MIINLETGEQCQATLRVEIPSEYVDTAREKITQKILRQAKLPGYRPGKAPRAIVEKRFQKAIEEELETQLEKDALREATAKEKLNVLHVRSLNAVSNVDLTYSVVGELLISPSFELPDYKGIPVTVPNSEIRDEHLERVIADWKENNADYQDEPEGTAVKMGHYLHLDYAASLDGEAIDPAAYPEAQAFLQRKGAYLFVDETQFLTGFCGELLDHKAGETFSFKLTLPDDFPVDDLKSKELTYEVTIHKILRKELPELNDERVNETTKGHAKTVEEFKEAIKKQLAARIEAYINESSINQALEWMHGALDFDLPKELVDSETQGHVDRIVQNSQQQGVPEDVLMEKEGEIVDAASTMGRRDVKTKFILSQISEKEKLTVSNQEMTRRIAYLAQRAGIPLKKAIKNVEQNGRARSIYEELLFAKALDFIRTNANVAINEAENALDKMWEESNVD